MGNRVEGSEQVARILNNDWFEDGRLMHLAFALNYGETYLSVNRLAVPTCPSDVKSFVEEVEPRDFHTKSHAGIFTRYQQKNVKAGEKLVVNHDNEIASDVILLKVQFSLLRQALVETCKL